MLDAYVKHQDLNAAEDIMDQTRQAGMINVVSFDTLIKAYLQREQFAKGARVNRRNEEGGPAANLANFNELINAMIYKGSAQGRADVWGIVAETQEAGVKPNRVTCSTLLKCLDANSKEQNIARTMNLISSMDEPMDEVLLLFVGEAQVQKTKIF